MRRVIVLVVLVVLLLAGCTKVTTEPRKPAQVKQLKFTTIWVTREAPPHYQYSKEVIPCLA
ncbi:MAG TPA: hypothetical protein VE439_01160 [Anaerolineae bacterium]|nr:hypothetical protein [Anaerolineae bacterium]